MTIGARRMSQSFLSSVASTSSFATQKRIKSYRLSEWLSSLANWSHALTLTMAPTSKGQPPSSQEVLRRCRLFLNRVSRRWYRKRGTKQGYRIASAAFLGWGAYGLHPHVHWVLEKPVDQSNEDFEWMLMDIAKTTTGLGRQIDIQRYYGPKWLTYMTSHGFEGWQDCLTFAAKCPEH